MIKRNTLLCLTDDKLVEILSDLSGHDKNHHIHNEIIKSIQLVSCNLKFTANGPNAVKERQGKKKKNKRKKSLALLILYLMNL